MCKRNFCWDLKSNLCPPLAQCGRYFLKGCIKVVPWESLPYPTSHYQQVVQIRPFFKENRTIYLAKAITVLPTKFISYAVSPTASEWTRVDRHFARSCVRAHIFSFPLVARVTDRITFSRPVRAGILPPPRGPKPQTRI